MTRTHARSPVGERAAGKKGQKQGNISMVGAIRVDEILALYPYDGAIDGVKFLSFLDEHLIPTLKPDDVIVMDNLRVHHIAEVKTRLENAGARALYLPPYSPERNPIEETWSLIKRVFRTAEARTIGAFVDTLNTAKDCVTKSKIEGFFKHAGYGLET